ncbi:MAG: hypothetical protein COT73_12515 [Bdellovibrio sp. CG10_big_fil_rev_8_21_14_0_10_47_8]|nr:MAG: hypothetical protein COT73_12515 [Bdellovibrio sp. CG10_big_fil_rev_8_21_14_0_10_47_8]
MVYLALRAALLDQAQGFRTILSVISAQIYFTGWQAIPLISVLALASGGIVILQSSSNLNLLGGAQMIGNLLVVIIVRELGPLMTALVVIARSGTAVASEVGNMRANREIEALESMGINPLSYIVFPRIVGGVISVVCLAFYFTVISLIGGFLLTKLLQDLPMAFYLDSLANALAFEDLWLFLLKNIFSGIIIFVVSCYQGLSVKRSPFVPLLLSVLVIEDIVAVTAMAFFGSLRAEGAELTTITGILFSILSSLVLMVFAYAVLMKLLQKFIETYKQSFKKEYIMQFALALSVLMAFLAMAIGLSPAVGAFLAGSIISRLSIREEVESTMSHFTLAFSSYFFISIGLLVNPIILIAELPVILGLSALFWVFAFLSTAIVAFLTGQTTRDSIFAGMSMAVMGEFSLLLAKEASPLLPSFDMVTVFASIVFITATFTSITLSRREQICHFVCAHQPRSLFSRLVLAQRYLSSVITEFESGGKLVRNTKAHFSEITKNLALFAGSGFVILLLRTYLKQENFAIPILNARVPPDAALLLFLLLLPSLFKLAFSMRDVADSASQVFLKHGYVRRKDIKHKLLENASIFLVLAGLFIFFPIASRLLLLPGAFGLVSMLPLLGMLIVAYSTIRLILRFFSRDGLAN